jgi:hypothetical protein
VVKVVGELERLATAAPQGPPGEKGERQEYAFLEKGQDLMKRVAVLKHFLASPNGAPLKGSFERRGMDRVLEGIVQTHQTATLGQNINEIGEVQNKLKWVELFLLAVYAVELIHIVGDALWFQHTLVGVWLLATVPLSALFGYLALHPKRLSWGLLVWFGVGLASLTLYTVLGLVLKKEPRHAASHSPDTGHRAAPLEHQPAAGQRLPPPRACARRREAGAPDWWAAARRSEALTAGAWMSRARKGMGGVCFRPDGRRLGWTWGWRN